MAWFLVIDGGRLAWRSYRLILLACPPRAGRRSGTYDVPVPQPAFVSYAQNGEDVVLWRALHSVSHGRYVEVGANHPRVDSVTCAFYNAGWSGITVEPVPQFAALHRVERPRDQLVEAAVSSSAATTVQLHMVPGTGLSTLVDAVSQDHEHAGIGHVDVTVPVVRLDALLDEAGWADGDIHFMLIDVEGAERSVLETIDLARWRPWILVVESTAPNSTKQTHSEWEDLLLGGGYEFCLFDGLSRFYVASERADQLRTLLSYPACVLDGFVTDAQVQAQRERSELLEQAIHWRKLAITGWAQSVGQSLADPVASAEVAHLQTELEAMRRTLSWRLTRGLRFARRAVSRSRLGR